MNKKQRNRKLVTQNKRNRIINRRYTSTIKNLFKLLLFKISNFKTNFNFLNNKELKNEYNLEEKENYQTEKKKLQILLNNLYSIIDKAIKKQVIHKNTAARKKSKISKIFFKI
jgi:small subunit ribosomal protein S20